ncbi:PIN domain-containing protein [Cellulomonas sp. JH27-2]|uniref:TA system VapC family ribonuclease toxin n=1 Tax=Cellulomonas sp. JH27-2 TaxID=2774139 RepID=UPI0017813C67|nr:TA system VapC family ribonuclease toxin [Cellulomonas sp. JH27-2]MBD8057956.1 PIN domain-containing protein [Cellulomonas sp. JH27-2]
MPENYLLDANVLIALTNAGHVHHGAAHRWFATISAWATTPLTETAFVRLTCNPAVVGQDVAPTTAIGALSALRAQPGHRWLPDDTTLAAPAVTLTLGGYRQVTDFHLVNLAASTGAVLATFDARLPAALTPGDRRHVQVLDPT